MEKLFQFNRFWICWKETKMMMTDMFGFVVVISVNREELASWNEHVLFNFSNSRKWKLTSWWKSSRSPRCRWFEFYARLDSLNNAWLHTGCSSILVQNSTLGKFIFCIFFPIWYFVLSILSNSPVCPNFPLCPIF